LISYDSANDQVDLKYQSIKGTLKKVTYFDFEFISTITKLPSGTYSGKVKIAPVTLTVKPTNDTTGTVDINVEVFFEKIDCKNEAIHIENG